MPGKVLAALRTATLNPARVLADLVLLEADPLADISNTQRIRAVIANGRLFRRADLDQLLARIEALHQPGREWE